MAVQRELAARITAYVDAASFAKAASDVQSLINKGFAGRAVETPLTPRPAEARAAAQATVRSLEDAVRESLPRMRQAMESMVGRGEVKKLIADFSLLQREAQRLRAPGLVQDIQAAKTEAIGLLSTIQRIPRGAGKAGVVGISPEQKQQLESSIRDLIGRSAEAFKTVTRAADLTPYLQQLRSYQAIASRVGMPGLVQDLRVILGVGDQVARQFRIIENAATNTARASRQQVAAQQFEARSLTAIATARTKFAGITDPAQFERIALQMDLIATKARGINLGGVETQARGAAAEARRFAQGIEKVNKGLIATVGGVELNITRLATWALGWFFIYRAINLVTSALSMLTIGGVAKFAEFQRQVFRLAAELVNIDPGRPFRDAMREAEQVLTTMTKLRAAFIGTDIQLQELVVTASRFGIIRDLTDETLAKLVVFGNLILNMGAQGARTNQIFGETQSIMERVAQAGDQVLRAIKSLDPEWKKNLENAAATGKTLDYILSLFPGYQEQVKFVNELLAAQIARMDSILNRILRIAATPFAKEILAGLKAAADFLEKYERQAAAGAAAIGKGIMGGIAAALILVAPKAFRALGAFAANNFVGGFKGIGFGAMFLGLSALAQHAGIQGGAAYAVGLIGVIGGQAVAAAIASALAKTNLALVGAYIGRALIAGIAAALASPATIALAIGLAIGTIAGSIIRAWKRVGDAADNAVDRQRAAIAANLYSLRVAAAEYAKSIDALQAKFKLGDISTRSFIEGLAAEQIRVTNRIQYIIRSLSTPGLSKASVSALTEEYQKLLPELDKVRGLIKDASDEQLKLINQRFDEYIEQINRVRDALADLSFRHLRAEGKGFAADLAELAHSASLAIEEFSKIGKESPRTVAAILRTLQAETLNLIREETKQYWETWRDAYEKAVQESEKARDAQISHADAIVDAITRPLQIQTEGMRLPEIAGLRDVEQYYRNRERLEQMLSDARIQSLNEQIRLERELRREGRFVDRAGSFQRELDLLGKRRDILAQNITNERSLADEKIRARLKAISDELERQITFLKLREQLLQIKAEAGIGEPDMDAQMARIRAEQARLTALRETLQAGIDPGQARKLLIEYQSALQKLIQMYPNLAANPLWDPEMAVRIAKLKGTVEGLQQILDRPVQPTGVSEDALKPIKAVLEEMKKVSAELAKIQEGVAARAINEFNRIGAYLRDEWTPYVVSVFSQAGTAAGAAFRDAWIKAFGTIPTPQSPTDRLRERERGGAVLPGPTITATGGAPVTNVYLGSVNLNDVLTPQTKRDLIRELLGAAGLRHQAYLNATGAGVSA